MRRTGLNDGWSVRPRRNPFAEMRTGPAEWAPVTLPHDAMISGERSPDASHSNAYFVGGTWEYRRTVVPSEPVSSVVLELEGVYRDAVVLVNGTIAAHRPYGYATFSVPIDHLLRPGEENELIVQARAGDDSRWYSGGGIYRDVWLLEGGPVHLAHDGLDVHAAEVDDEGAVVTVAAVVRNRSGVASDATLRVELIDADGGVVAQAETPVTSFPGDDITARQRLFVANPHRWGVGASYLYRCQITLLDGDRPLDEETAAFGIRSLTLDPRRGLRINGETVKLRGACVHHDNGVLGAATFARAEERRVELLQEAGFNAIRSSHHPMSRAMLDACDRLGVVVMDETFDMWAQQKSDDDYALRFAAEWEADVEAMVHKDRNHPSVVFYSIGNEIPDGSTPSGLRIARALADKVRSLDDTRFVTQAVNGLLVGGPAVFDELRASFADTTTDETTGVNTAAMNLGDIMGQAMLSSVVSAKTVEAFAHLDAAGYNYMDTRFARDAEQYPNRVIVATETYPPTIAVGWAGVTQHDNVVGDFTWTGWDYLGEVGIGRVEYGDEAVAMGASAFNGPYPWLAAWCGDIDIIGQRRPQSHYREIVFGLSAGPYIAVERPQHHGRVVVHESPWGWPDVVGSWSWEGSEGAPINVHVYADSDEVELVVNGTSVGREKVGGTRPHVALFDTRYEPGTLEAIAWRDGHEVGRSSLRSATGDVVLQADVDRGEVRGDGTDLAFVELTLVDAQGALHHTRDGEITIALDGPAVLQGFGSANPCTDEQFNDAVHTSFDGRALAVIRAIDEGTITVTATLPRAEPARVRIEATAP